MPNSNDRCMIQGSQGSVKGLNEHRKGTWYHHIPHTTRHNGLQHRLRNVCRSKIQNNNTLTTHSLELCLQVWDELFMHVLCVNDA